MKQTDWYASPQLKRLYERYVEQHGINQRQFAKESGIGSQPYVSLLICREKPLGLDNAVRFARTLRCSIYDVCPEMADYIAKEALPVLGKALRRAAVFAALSIGVNLLGLDNKSIAASSDGNISAKSGLYTHCARLLRRIFSAFTKACRSRDYTINDLAGKSGFSGNTAGWIRPARKPA